MDWFLYSKATPFDQPPGCLGGGLLPEANRLVRGVDRCAHILTTPLRAHLPDLIQHFDRTAGVDFAQEMNPSSRQRHMSLGYQMTQASSQPLHTYTASHF